jgi:hypothetical protein
MTAPTPPNQGSGPRVVGAGAPGPAPRIPPISVKNRKMRDPEMLALDPDTLDPTRHYRWVRCRADEHLLSVQKHKLAGYQLELMREGGPRTVVEPDRHPDNRIAIGDLVLMSCPQSLYDERERERLARNEMLLASTSAQTEQTAREKGVSIIKDKEG